MYYYNGMNYTIEEVNSISIGAMYLETKGGKEYWLGVNGKVLVRGC